jgi:hypothetical protein
MTLWRVLEGEVKDAANKTDNIRTDRSLLSEILYLLPGSPYRGQVHQKRMVKPLHSLTYPLNCANKLISRWV